MALPPELRNLKIGRQGKAVAERVATGWLLMLPDGVVTHHRSRKAVLRAVNKYFDRAVNESGIDIGIGMIEWRR